MKKIGESFKGIFGGFILLIVAGALLWWNEGNNVKNLKTTAEMEKVVIDVRSESIDKNNEGKLIATHGKLINEEVLNDADFSVSLKTPKLVRIVEMYQWEEEKHTDDDDKTTYSYKKVWSESVIDSGSFHETGHENPGSMPYKSQTYLSTSVQVGAFNLNDSQISILSTDGNFSDLSTEVATNLNYKVYGTYYTTSDNLDNPNVGDIRVSFKYNNSNEVSVLAVQTGNTFTDYTSSVGKTESRLMDGVHSGKEMVEVIKKENNILKWILRGAGVLLMFIGFATILKPISTIGGYIPLLGGVLQGAVGLISFILGLAVSLVVIAIAWIRFRPILGIALLVVVVGLIVLLKKRTSKKKAEVPTDATQGSAPITVDNTPVAPQEPTVSEVPTTSEVPSTPETPVATEPSVTENNPINNDNNNQPL